MKKRLQFPKMSGNRLLVLHLALWMPLWIPAVLFHGWFSIIAFLFGPLDWALLNYLNRAAWRRHFRPKLAKEPV